MSDPFVSVIVARQHAGDHLPAAFENLRAQTFQNLEVIACPAADSSASRRNQLIRESRGAYIALFDSDDRWNQHKLEKQVSLLCGNASLGWCYCGAEGHSAGNAEFQRGHILRPLFLKDFIPRSSVLIRRTVFEKCGGFSEFGSHPRSDEWDLWLRIAAACAADFIAEPLVSVQECLNDVEQLYRSRLLVVEAVLARYPGLTNLRSESLAEICVAAGNAHLRAGRREAARQKFAEALTHNPVRSEAYVSWAASFLPSEAQQQLRDLHNLGVKITEPASPETAGRKRR